jgi:hypothetical protein
MGQITVQPDHKTEQRNEPAGDGDFDRLALRFCVLVGFYGLVDGNTPQTIWRNWTPSFQRTV